MRRFYRCRRYDNRIGLLCGPEKFIGAPVLGVKWEVLVPARLAFWKFSAGRALSVFVGVSYPVCEILLKFWSGQEIFLNRYRAGSQHWRLANASLRRCVFCFVDVVLFIDVVSFVGRWSVVCGMCMWCAYRICVYMYIYVYICMDICMYIYVWIYVCISTYVCDCVFVCVRVRARVRARARARVLWRSVVGTEGGLC